MPRLYTKNMIPSVERPSVSPSAEQKGCNYLFGSNSIFLFTDSYRGIEAGIKTIDLEFGPFAGSDEGTPSTNHRNLISVLSSSLCTEALLF